MMPPVVKQADVTTRRSFSSKNLGGIVTRWQTTSRGGFILMPPPKKKKSSSSSSKSEPQQSPVNPKVLGIVGGIAVLAIVGYVAISQMSSSNDAAQNAINQPIVQNNNPQPVGDPPAGNANLPMAIPGNAAAQPNKAGAPAQGGPGSMAAESVSVEISLDDSLGNPGAPMPIATPPVAPVVAPGAMTPSSNDSAPKKTASRGPSKNPLVSLIKGGMSSGGLAGGSFNAADATLFITLEDGQHIPVTSQEHQAYFRGELQKAQIERLISRSRNFSIDNGTFERIGSSAATGNTLIASQLDPTSIQSFLAVVTVKKSTGEVATATGCLIHPDGGLLVPAETLKNGVDLTVEFQNQKFRTSDIVMGYSDPNSRLAILELPTQQQIPVAPIAQPANASLMGMAMGAASTPVSISLVGLENNKMQRQEVSAQPTSYQLLTNDATIPVPGNWLDVNGNVETSLGKPLFDANGALYGYTVAPSMDNPLAVVAVGVESIRPLTTIALTTGVKQSSPTASPAGTPPAVTPPPAGSSGPALAPIGAAVESNAPTSGGGRRPGRGGLSGSGTGGSGETSIGAAAPEGSMAPVGASQSATAGSAPGGAVGATPTNVPTPPSGAASSGSFEGATAGVGVVAGGGSPGSGFSPDPQAADETTRKVQELIFAPSIANTKKGSELLTSIRWIQLGTLVKMNVGSAPPATVLGRVMNTLGRQSVEKTEVNIANADKADQSAVLLCVINYKAPVSLDPTGLTTASTQQDIDMVFRLLAFAKDPKDPTGKSYLRVLEVEPMTIRVPSTFQDQGASRTMKEQISNMYNKFHSGIRKAKRDLGKS